MGLDSLPPLQLAHLKVGNATFHVSCRFINCCRKVGVPVFLENPDGSLMRGAPSHDYPEAIPRFPPGPVCINVSLEPRGRKPFESCPGEVAVHLAFS
eukprot:6285835-Pyramimonas_sp.AAC.1